MYWFISLWLCHIISTRAFILQDTYNVLLKDDKDYEVDLIITDNDYEMIDEKHLKDYKLDKEKYKFEELDKMAERENLKVSKLRAKIVKQPYEANLHTISVKGNNNKTKLTTSTEPRLITKTSKRQIEPENDEDYDYDELVNEYNEQAINESQVQQCVSHKSTDTTNCSYEEGIGLIAVKCLIEDYVNHRQTLREVMGRLWRIFLIWFLVYLAVAIPLWCTRGWCCCCLCCKFFKPRQTIEEAKRYVVSYPPGILKTKSGEILYEPTDREKECYEEFQHFIKIL
ncbi:hypothetical protein HW555_007915 [Spodoptera exigua]|uniref:Uncharacterized protein n=1 Tax=Spodoptera exigua TaxID=7107 RepID=A0A835GFB4_SPOEX|nr:hypothetical protein HW555_007915 [Spodoptera exigua]